MLSLSLPLGSPKTFFQGVDGIVKYHLHFLSSAWEPLSGNPPHHIGENRPKRILLEVKSDLEQIYKNQRTWKLSSLSDKLIWEYRICPGFVIYSLPCMLGITFSVPYFYIPSNQHQFLS